jgi:ribosomal-protein-alanine N-acetyltransferase
MHNKIKFLEGKNVYLRPFLKRDLKGNYIKWINNLRVNFFLETGKLPINEKDLEEYYKNSLKSKNSILFAICNNSDKHIGNCSISQIDWINRRCLYGRMIGEQKNVKKGSGTEVLKIIQKYVFYTLNLNSMWTGVCADNISSLKSNINCNMNKVGIFKEAFFRDNKYLDVVIFSITKKEFEKINGK